MRQTIQSIATLGKSMTIKRVKVSDAEEVTRASLAFIGCFIPRELIDPLLGMPSGWAASTLFADTGEPIARLSISADRKPLTVSGRLVGPQDVTLLALLEAELSSLEVLLTENGANLSGRLTWLVRGDEAEDAEQALGRDVAIDWTVTDGGQGDLFKAGETGEDGADDDELLPAVVAYVRGLERVTVSGIGSRFGVGYNRAARLVETLEAIGVVGPLQANGTRAVIEAGE